ncbi:hypothetical protein Noda2021_04270 [Candidatus Dependentiae bacterium Noda2021]|nr:hypothetical protein Noda2021_04270 [Candidatus Dependentiae bacterium Noda2021]
MTRVKKKASAGAAKSFSKKNVKVSGLLKRKKTDKVASGKTSQTYKNRSVGKSSKRSNR